MVTEHEAHAEAVCQVDVRAAGKGVRVVAIAAAVVGRGLLSFVDRADVIAACVGAR